MKAIRAITSWFSSLKRFLQSTIREAKRIQWPTRQQTIRLTVVVVVSSVIIGIALFLIDLALFEGLRLLI